MKKIILPVLAAFLFAPAIAPAAAESKAAFNMQILDTQRVPSRGIVMTGKIEHGSVSNGDSLCVPVSEGGTVGHQVAGMEMLSKLVDTAGTGDNIGILVSDIKEDRIAVGQQLRSGYTP